MVNHEKEEPLLYIEQPTFEKPVAFMQNNYSSLMKERTEHHEETDDDQSTYKSEGKDNPFVAVLQNGENARETEIVDEKLIEEEVSKGDSISQDNITFNDLSIQGKIDYFINLPAEMPKIKSEIVLDKDVYRGYILQDNGDKIVIETGRVEEIINKNEINDIILIGF